MSITKKEVEHISWLARLYLTEEEKDTFAGQLSDILAHAEKVSGAQTADVPEWRHILPITNVLREDVVEDSIDVEDALENAPQRENDGFVVPQIV